MRQLDRPLTSISTIFSLLQHDRLLQPLHQEIYRPTHLLVLSVGHHDDLPVRSRHLLVTSLGFRGPVWAGMVATEVAGTCLLGYGIGDFERKSSPSSCHVIHSLLRADSPET